MVPENNEEEDLTMPNIEIHMPFDHAGHPTIMDALEIEKRIWLQTKTLPFADEIVVSHHNTFCMDRNAKDRPYIRISSSHPDHVEPLLDALKDLGIDIETLILKGFFAGSQFGGG